MKIKIHKKVVLGLAVLVITGFSTKAFAVPSPENGVIREHYSNGKLHFEIRFKDGLVIRKRYYYRNGRKLLDQKYKDGKLLIVRHYYDNGRLKSIWTRKKGKMRYYDRYGKLKTTIKTSNEHIAGQYRPSYIASPK